jgi:hypothetical protein
MQKSPTSGGSREGGTTQTNSPTSANSSAITTSAPFVDTTTTTPGQRVITTAPRTDTQTAVYGDINKTGKRLLTETDIQNIVERQTVQNMDASSLAALQATIKSLMQGGSPSDRGQKAKRDQTMALVQGLLKEVSQKRAVEDAQGMINLLMEQQAEQNMPAIQRAIEGAGTSASSMQALLSQKAQRDTALAAGSLGSQQQQAYAAQRTGLANVLEAFSRVDNSATDQLLSALGIAKGATQQVDRAQTTTSTKSIEDILTELTQRAPDVTTSLMGKQTQTINEAPTTQTTRGGERKSTQSGSNNQSGSTSTLSPNRSNYAELPSAGLSGVSGVSDASGGIIMGGANASQSALGQIGNYWNPNKSSLYDFLKG